MNIRAVDAHVVYRTHMSEAKLRLLAAERVLKSNTPLTGLAALDSEFCFLQIRKVIELITFSAIKREEGRYSKLREQDRQSDQRDHGNPAKDWQAAEILKRLVSLSPHVLPIPVTKGTQLATGQMHFERQKLSVNHGRLIELYKECGGYMHAKNPLVADYAAYIEHERAKYEAAPAEARHALEFLRKLLWQHAVVQLSWSDPNNPTVANGPESAWLVDFGTTEGEDIVLVLAAAT